MDKSAQPSQRAAWTSWHQATQAMQAAPPLPPNTLTMKMVYEMSPLASPGAEQHAYCRASETPMDPAMTPENWLVQAYH